MACVVCSVVLCRRTNILPVPKEKILFLTDVYQEAVAADAAGLGTTITNRYVVVIVLIPITSREVTWLGPFCGTVVLPLA